MTAKTAIAAIAPLYHFFVKVRQIFLASSFFLSLCPLRSLRFVSHIVWRIFIQNWY
ncbi:hypothetical protein [Nostoc sp. 'Lobaria pulmonaria (5183) cyanobiont']|uniref:hypothetical protein n=1 Tax=Nostoc sp. 'Lobaria pulmonaria (5183) cyanobiont' TaxID=1618022 RepID=UPI00131A3161|nr:hypothetical protein [Nostoc sp. 'Lobaria pulmonaria (5183) cyanobiont']